MNAGGSRTGEKLVSFGQVEQDIIVQIPVEKLNLPHHIQKVFQQQRFHSPWFNVLIQDVSQTLCLIKYLFDRYFLLVEIMRQYHLRCGERS
jgi:hypothetical protein